MRLGTVLAELEGLGQGCSRREQVELVRESFLEEEVRVGLKEVGLS